MMSNTTHNTKICLIFLCLLFWLLLFFTLISLDPDLSWQPGKSRAYNELEPPVSLEFEEYKDETYSNKQVVRGLWSGQVSSLMLSLRLQIAKRMYMHSKEHKVTYKKQYNAWQSRTDVGQMLCQLKKHGRFRTLNGLEEPFSSLGWEKLVPSQPLEKLYRNQPYNTCAVVSSAAAILGSGLGKEIDAHDAVIRFNDAPTTGYQNDVGSKTNIRLVNSQVLAKPEFEFSSSPLYKNVTLVAWDPAPYSLNLFTWYFKPDFDLFTPYTDRRRTSPDQLFYILHPSFVWSLWDMVQYYSTEDIQPNPPSSGFIGIVLAMNLCKEVNVYEFIPSKRHTTLCHYYGPLYFDMACTFGAYHPLLFEKLLIRKMSKSSFNDIMNKGKITLPGLCLIKCPHDDSD